MGDERCTRVDEIGTKVDKRGANEIWKSNERLRFKRATLDFVLGTLQALRPCSCDPHR